MGLCRYHRLVPVIRAASDAAAHCAKHGVVTGVVAGNAACDRTTNAAFGFSLDRRHDHRQRGGNCERNEFNHTKFPSVSADRGPTVVEVAMP